MSVPIRAVTSPTITPVRGELKAYGNSCTDRASTTNESTQSVLSYQRVNIWNPCKDYDSVSVYLICTFQQ